MTKFAKNIKVEKKVFFFIKDIIIDFGTTMKFLTFLTEIEQNLIIRVQIYLQVWQIKDQKYAYSGHIGNFIQNVTKIYQNLNFYHLSLILTF